MEAFKTFTGVVAPLDRSNVDTDAIIPKKWRKERKRKGEGEERGEERGEREKGEEEREGRKRQLNEEGGSNEGRYAGFQVLLEWENFGCVCLRDSAPSALADHGFKVILAPSFADIFFNNCFKNGILPIRLSGAQIDGLFAKAGGDQALRITVDLQAQTLTLADGEVIGFEVDEFRKQCLLEGLDDIGLTLRHSDEIAAFEQQRRAKAPWVFT